MGWLRNLLIGGTLTAAITLISACTSLSRGRYTSILERNFIWSGGNLIGTLEGVRARQYPMQLSELEKSIMDNASIVNLTTDSDYEFEVMRYCPNSFDDSRHLPNIVILPTLGEPANSMRALPAILATKGNNVWVMSYSGYSLTKENGLDTREYFETIHTLVEKFIPSVTNDKIVLIGFSHGGEVSFLYCCDNSETEVDGMALFAVYLPSIKNAQYDHGVRLMQAPLIADIGALFYGKYVDFFKTFGGHNFYNGIDLLEQVRDDPGYKLKISSRSYIEFVRFIPDGSYEDLRMPILMIASENDKVIPIKQTVLLIDELKNAGLDVLSYITSGKYLNVDIDDCHMSSDVNPHELAYAIHRYVHEYVFPFEDLFLENDVVPAIIEDKRAILDTHTIVDDKDYEPSNERITMVEALE